MQHSAGYVGCTRCGLGGPIGFAMEAELIKLALVFWLAIFPLGRFFVLGWNGFMMTQDTTLEARRNIFKFNINMILSQS